MEKPIKNIKKYTVTTTEYTDGTFSQKRENEGYNTLELLGLLEFARNSVFSFLEKKLPPKRIERTYKEIE